MKEIESGGQDLKARRKILGGIGIGMLSLFSFFKSGLFRKNKPVISCAPPTAKNETIKVLSQDGRLVEVDVSKIKRLKEKISDEELKSWIRKG
jgi:hypothetical protein